MSVGDVAAKPRTQKQSGETLVFLLHMRMFKQLFNVTTLYRCAPVCHPPPCTDSKRPPEAPMDPNQEGRHVLQANRGFLYSRYLTEDTARREIWGP